MGVKRDLMEYGVWIANQVSATSKTTPNPPASIFILRNNDIGDVLVATPLFCALKRHFPQSKIVAGIGAWTTELLDNNPFVDVILPVNAPWHNQKVFPSGPLAALKYIARSPEVSAIQQCKCEVGIDFLGSPFGSLLLMRAGIPWRLGVKGYAGGHSGVQQSVAFDGSIHVAQAGLSFASLLGVRDLPEARPQLFLTKAEEQAGKRLWSNQSGKKKVVLAPGGGYQAKCWPAKSFNELLRFLGDAEVVVIGGPGDRLIAEQICQGTPQAHNLAGRISLREVFSLIAAADTVICNSSMAMHVAAAFRKPCLVLLGEAFPSAKEHQRLWGYPETRMLGKEPGAPVIATVQKACQAFAHLV